MAPPTPPVARRNGLAPDDQQCQPRQKPAHCYVWYEEAGSSTKGGRRPAAGLTGGLMPESRCLKKEPRVWGVCCAECLLFLPSRRSYGRDRCRHDALVVIAAWAEHEAEVSEALTPSLSLPQLFFPTANPILGGWSAAE
ncbi:hypothetical protein CDD83_5765 [Cordyceps sp. RAO-2017]|nr:hypothetical protein CDD83_5765 [Cordyceps sp. RAO-2017]